MTTHTGFYLRPTLAEQVEGWCGVGFKAREAVRELIQLRLRQASAKGGGHRAARRAAKLKARTVTEFVHAYSRDFPKSFPQYIGKIGK